MCRQQVNLSPSALRIKNSSTKHKHIFQENNSVLMEVFMGPIKQCTESKKTQIQEI
jgi:hypothetical protein